MIDLREIENKRFAAAARIDAFKETLASVETMKLGGIALEEELEGA